MRYTVTSPARGTEKTLTTTGTKTAVRQAPNKPCVRKKKKRGCILRKLYGTLPRSGATTFHAAETSSSQNPPNEGGGGGVTYHYLWLCYTRCREIRREYFVVLLSYPCPGHGINLHKTIKRETQVIEKDIEAHEVKSSGCFERIIPSQPCMCLRRRLFHACAGYSITDMIPLFDVLSSFLFHQEKSGCYAYLLCPPPPLPPFG